MERSNGERAPKTRPGRHPWTALFTAAGLALLLTAGAGTAAAWQVTLLWDANTEPDLTGYTIHYGTASGAYTAKIPVGNVTTYTVTGLEEGRLYYFAATASDSLGNESGYSNEVVDGSLPLSEIALLGNGAAIANGDATPAASDHTDFGSLEVAGGALTRTFTIRNDGTGELAFPGSPRVAVEGAAAAEFTVTAQPSSPVAAGGSTTFQVRFDPGAAGTRSATLRIPSNDPDENPFTFRVQGTGTVSDAPVPEIDLFGNGVGIPDGDTTPAAADHTDFGQASIDGGTVTRTFTIRNTGTGALSLSGSPRVAIGGAHAADFSVVAQPSSPVAAGGSTTFQVRFDPSAGGARGATIAVASSDADENPFNFSIVGTGLAPEINLVGNAARIAHGDMTPGVADHTDFGRSNVAAETVTRTFTIQNTGSAALSLPGSPRVKISGADAGDFAVVAAPPSSVSAGGSAAFQVRFDPRDAGVRTATLSIANNDPDEKPYEFALQGTGVIAPEIVLLGGNKAVADGDTSPSSSDSTDFGATKVDGGAVTRTFTIRNTGSAPLNLSGSPPVAVTGTHAADYAIVAQPPAVLPPGGSAAFKVVFDPAAAGVRTATVALACDDADENPYTFAIQGSGTVPKIAVVGNSVEIANGDASPTATDFTDFGPVKVGSGSVVRTFTIRNLGLAPLTLPGAPRVTVGGAHAAEFAITVRPASPVAAGGRTTFQVRFTPAAAGARSATLSIVNNDPSENPYDIVIRGTGTVPEINLLGNGARIGDGDQWPSLADHTDFGSANVTGGAVTRTFTVQNTGTAALRLSAPVITGESAADFAVAARPPASVAPGGSVTFQVRFDPRGAGLRKAAVSIGSDDADERPYDFSIQGAGFIAPEIGLFGNAVAIAAGDATPAAPDHTDFGAVKLDGGRVTRTFTIRNTGSAPLNLSGAPPVAVAGAHAADFTVTAPPAATVAAGGSTTFKVTFDPVAAGVRAATLRIADDDPDENPYEFAVQGEGVAPPAPPTNVSITQ